MNVHECTCIHIKSVCKHATSSTYVLNTDASARTLNFPVQLHHQQVGEPYAVDPYSAMNKWWWPYTLYTYISSAVVLYVHIRVTTTLQRYRCILCTMNAAAHTYICTITTAFVVVVVFTLKNRSDLYSVPSNIRTGPTDANAFCGHRLTTQEGTYCEKSKRNKRTQKSQHTRDDWKKVENFIFLRTGTAPKTSNS